MSKFYSQNGQDRYLYNNFFKNKNKGFFIEIGADDGIDKSNTYFFEKLGWNGICVEASPSRFIKLKQNRNCLLVNKAISQNNGILEFLDIQGYGKGFSGLVNDFHPKHLKRIDGLKNHKNFIKKEVIEVECITLQEILDQHKISEVDYCSIDVEGGELGVLKSIDWGRVNINIISLEDNFSDKKPIDFILNKGYKVINKIGADLILKRI